MLKKASYCLFTSLMIAAILFLITLISCSSDQIVTSSDYQAEVKGISKDQELVLRKNSALGFDLLKQINNSAVEENVFVSPLSISIAFQMLLNGAEGETFDEIARTLHLENSIDEINKAYKDLLKVLIVNNPEMTFNALNSIWSDINFNCKEEFIKINKEVYGAEIRNLDFTDPDAVLEINNWVKNASNGKISEIIDRIPANAVMYIINAVYFKSDWKYKFDPNENVNMFFHKEDGSKNNIEFMHQNSNFNFYKDDLLSYVELPYGKDSLYSMGIFVPANDRNADQVINEMDDNYWNYIIKHITKSDGQLFLPKFAYSYKIELSDILKKMGINKVFTFDAELNKIADGDLAVNRVIHKAAVEVNEEGSEAAGVTAIEIIKSAIDPNFYIVADKPFLFVIKDNVTNTVIFLGKLVDP